MANLVIHRREIWTQPPQDIVRVSERFASRLKFAIIPNVGLVNLSGLDTPIQTTGMDKLVGKNGVSYLGGKRSEFKPTLPNSNGVTLVSIWRARPSSNYLSADGTCCLIANRTAANAGWMWGRSSAVGGGANGNLTAQTYVINGVAQYFEPNFTIESNIDTPVACRYSKATGKVSWFRFGTRSSPDTTVSTSPSVGGNIVFGASGPYSDNGTPWLDVASVVLGFVGELSDSEIYDLTKDVKSVWGAFESRETRLFVPVAGGGSVNATGSGSLSPLSVVAPTASATGSASASASGSLAAISITAATGTASAGSSATASGSLASLSIAPPTATASASGVGSGAWSALSISPATGTASASATASGSLAAISVTAPTGTASAGLSATASGSLASVSVTPATASATASALASSGFASLSVSVAIATATGTTAGNAIASGMPAQITISPATASAIGSAVASGSLASLTISPPTGAATSAGDAQAIAAFAALSINPATGAAYGSAIATGSLPIISVSTATGSASTGSFSGSLSDEDIARIVQAVLLQLNNESIAAAVWAHATRVITGPTPNDNADALLARAWP